jgi:hypothetical protein
MTACDTRGQAPHIEVLLETRDKGLHSGPGMKAMPKWNACARSLFRHIESENVPPGSGFVFALPVASRDVASRVALAFGEVDKPHVVAAGRMSDGC